MLYNTYRAYTEADIVTGSDTLAAYSDRDKISDWAEDAAAFVIENEVMRGVSETEFSPGSYYTREQCYITFLRLYKNAPCSRRYENVKNLYTYEELVDRIVNSYSYVSLYSCETETCSVFFGYHVAAPHRADTAVEIVYKKGGSICLNEQFNNNTPFLENFTLSEDEKELYCTYTNNGKRYRITLETAKLEMVAAEEAAKTKK